MIKATIKYFLPLCILLVSGYNLMYAGTHQDYVAGTPTPINNEPSYTRFFPVSDSRAFLVSHVVPDAKKIAGIYVEANEEETAELFLIKKYINTGTPFTNITTQPVRDFLQNVKIRLSYFAYYSSRSYIRYILFRSIKI